MTNQNKKADLYKGLIHSLEERYGKRRQQLTPEIIEGYKWFCLEIERHFPEQLTHSYHNVKPQEGREWVERTAEIIVRIIRFRSFGDQASKVIQPWPPWLDRLRLREEENSGAGKS